ncbi:MAG: hypothetical protein OEO18_05350 [Gammaproteobacteria bacterium]|nr:hypothetical protein [Gammaproteobacteria bacterium]
MSEFKAAPPVTPNPVTQGSSASIAPVDVMLVGLRQRLESQPDDIDGWILLSKSYYHLQQFTEANEAFEKARALGYTGDWQPLPRIDAFGQNGITGQGRDSSVNTDTAVRPEDAGDLAGLKLKVSLNPAIANDITPGSAVFVFARSAINPGPPLAVIRRQAGDLPFEIALNDSHAMIADRTISSAERVIVGVRISASGNPQRQPGDYEQLSDPIPSNFAQPIEIVISDKI